MAKRKVQQPENISPVYIKRLKDQRRSLGLLQFESRADVNFTKWENMTENLVISCFGEDSNQHSQLNDLVSDLYDKYDLSLEFSSSRKIDPGEFKKKMKNLLTNFIDELELKTGTGYYSRGKRSTIFISPKIEVSATQIAIQKTEINQTISQILDKIRETEPNPEKVKEAEKNLGEFQEEIKKEKPEWSVIKRILAWLLEFSRDAFLQILPILIERYSK